MGYLAIMSSKNEKREWRKNKRKLQRIAKKLQSNSDEKKQDGYENSWKGQIVDIEESCNTETNDEILFNAFLEVRKAEETMERLMEENANLKNDLSQITTEKQNLELLYDKLYNMRNVKEFKQVQAINKIPLSIIPRRLDEKLSKIAWEYEDDSVAFLDAGPEFSKFMEPYYQEYLKSLGNDKQIHNFSRNKIEYKMDFKAMTQTNIDSKKVRKVRRQVITVSKSQPILNPIYVASVPCALNLNSFYAIEAMKSSILTIQEIKKSDSLYTEVSNLFLNHTDDTKYAKLSSNNKIRIEKIERIYNCDIHESYELNRNRLSRLGYNGEILLWHSSKDPNHENIIKFGPDPRVSKKDNYFGQAFYGSIAPQYSYLNFTPSYTNKHGWKSMILVACLTGNVFRAPSDFVDNTLTRGPISPSGDCYDSVGAYVDSQETLIYSFYSRESCEPRFRIYYKDDFNDFNDFTVLPDNDADLLD